MSPRRKIHRSRQRPASGTCPFPVVSILGLFLLLLPTSLTGQEGLDAELTAELEADYMKVREAEGFGPKDPGDDGIAAEPRSGRDVAPLPPDTELRDPRGTAVSKTTVMGLILVCKTYARTAGAMADRFESVRDGTVTDKKERLAEVEAAARELVDLEREWREAESDLANLLRSGTALRGATSDALERFKEEVAKAEAARDAAREAFLDRREALVAPYPELAVERDGTPFYRALGDFDAAAVETPGDESEGFGDWLVDGLVEIGEAVGALDTGEPVPEAAKMSLYNQYLETGRESMREQEEEADCTKRVRELWKYGSPAYRTTHELVRRLGEEEADAELPGDLMDEVEANYEAYETHQRVDDGWKDVVMTTAGALLIPLGPAICAGYGVIEIVKEGNDVVVAYRSAEEARARAPVEGYRHVVTEEERLAAEAGELAFTAVTVAPDFLEGVRAVRIVRPADDACVRPPPRIAEGEATPRTGGDADVPTGGGRPRTGDEAPDEVDAPGEAVDEAEDAARTGEDEDKLDLGELTDEDDWEAVDEVEEMAREAGVSDERIAEIRGANEDPDDAMTALYLESLRARGKTWEPPPSLCETADINKIWVQTRNNGGRFFPEHLEWLRSRMREDPSYIDDLANRGRLDRNSFTGERDSGFEPILNDEATSQLKEWFEQGEVVEPPPGTHTALSERCAPEPVADAGPPPRTDDPARPPPTGEEPVDPGAETVPPPGREPTEAEGAETVREPPPGEEPVDPGAETVPPPGREPTEPVDPEAETVTGVDEDATETQRLPAAEREAEERFRDAETAVDIDPEARTPTGDETPVDPGAETVPPPGREPTEPVDPGAETVPPPGREPTEAEGAETVREPPPGEEPVDPGAETVLEPGRTEPVDPEAETLTGDEPPAGAGGEAESPGDETRRLPPPDLPPPADEAADAGRTGEGGEPGEAGTPAGRTAGAGGQLGQAGREADKADELEEESRVETGGDAAGADAGAAGGEDDTAVAMNGLYEITQVIDPIDIVLTPIGSPEEDPSLTDPGAETGVVRGPETGGPPTAGGGGPPSGGGGEGGDEAGETGDEGEEPAGGDEAGLPGDEPGQPGDEEDGDETEVRLNDGGAGEILNSPIVSGAPRAPDVQVMIILSVNLDLASPMGSRVTPSPALASGGPAGRISGPSPPADGRAWKPDPPMGGAPEVEAFLTSLGTSTGEAFELHVVNRGSSPVQLTGDGLVVEPVRLEEEARREVEDRVRELAAENPVAATLTGYCLEFLRRPPTAGQVFRIASQEVQERFAPARKLLSAARQVQDAGLLNPDSDPTGYFDSITQWAIWAVEQGLDAEGFEENFLEHTRKNLEAVGRDWTDEIEEAVRKLIPNRWHDVQRVLREAEELAVGAGSS